MKSRKTIEQVDVSGGARVLMRVDFNVPLDEQHRVTDDRRVRMALPSIRSVIDHGGRLVLMSHLGRPKGAGQEPALSLRPAAECLGRLLKGTTVRFVEGDCAGPAATEAVAAMAPGEVIVLENLRFNSGEKAGDPQFAGKLAAYGDVYCNEAFGTSHRRDASMVAVPRAMKGKPKVAGLLLETELKYLAEMMADPARPFIAVIGGAKVSDKLAAITNLMNKVDTILIGGAMAYSFLEALGHSTGSSLTETDMIETARRTIDAAAASPTDLILPRDHVCGRQVTHITPVEVFQEAIPAGWMGLDIGPDTCARYAGLLRQAKTVVWNGPVGVFETQPFDVGTRQIAEAIAEATDRGAVTVVGGGDTAAAVERFGLAQRFTHVSTGGGASLQVLEGKPLPGVEVLDEAAAATV